jgi:hypothetical protein
MFGPIAVLIFVSVLEGTHAYLVQQIRESFPSLVASLGRTGPGYYAFGLFWFSPTYRQLLTSGTLKAELARNPSLARVADFEVLLWYGMWLVVVLAVVL